MSEGRLYEMDMRLRPSGNKGPVATSWTSFQDYQRNEAWVWEHLALTRAAAIVGPDDLIHDIDAFRVALADLRNFETVAPALSKMRARFPRSNQIAVRGILKSDLVACRISNCFRRWAACLRTKRAERCRGDRGLVDLGIIDQAQGDTLQTAYEQFWTLQLGSKLLSEAHLILKLSGMAGKVLFWALANQISSTHCKTNYVARNSGAFDHRNGVARTTGGRR